MTTNWVVNNPVPLTRDKARHDTILRRMCILNYLYLALSLIAGLALGSFFFGGLWWTVQKMQGSRNPYLVSVISFILRTAVAMLVFYLLLKLGTAYLVASLVGFIVARTYLAYRLQPR